MKLRSLLLNLQKYKYFLELLEYHLKVLVASEGRTKEEVAKSAQYFFYVDYLMCTLKVEHF